ncbi:ribosomal RNA processing protein [Naganishia friedmannii]|uniref:Ribosomal RNA processing protein n=1 Tax=Naganishia friedmannii TaxID=89922 RepID=A0ACC2V922_9TREE|nr:ribosomal RNA processing protein [Naganishia friedmannii]
MARSALSTSSRSSLTAQPKSTPRQALSNNGRSGQDQSEGDSQDDEDDEDEEGKDQGDESEENGGEEGDDVGSDEEDVSDHGDNSEDEQSALDDDEVASEVEQEVEVPTFAELGVIPELCSACSELGFTKPTGIQAKSIPHALEGKDVIGLAQTGSGKTVAFALPILQSLWEKPQPFFALVLAPTRELAYQIHDQFNGLGRSIGLKTTVIVGGMEMTQQAIALSKRPHVIVATPGRLMDHLENTKGFSLRNLKYLVMDEADRLLDLDFGPILDKILKVIPKERNTYLFSATMTTKVAKLQRASLHNPVRIEVSTKYSTVSTLQQYFVLIPLKNKEAALIYLVNELASSSMIIFTRTVNDASRISEMFRILGVAAIPLHGQLSQSQRLAALNAFKSGRRQVLVATDVASRGLDIPAVDLVINYDMPTHSKDYIHRVGRTARAGRAGKAISLVTQYDVEVLQRIESVIGKKMDAFDVNKQAMAVLAPRVAEASRAAAMEMKENAKKGHGGKRGRESFGGRDDADRDDDTHEGGMPRKKFRGGSSGGGGGRGGSRDGGGRGSSSGGSRGRGSSRGGSRGRGGGGRGRN